MKIKYYGVRGSIPTPGPDTVKYGGNTPCVAVWNDDKLLVLDGGTGLRVLGDELMNTHFGQGKGIRYLPVQSPPLGSYPGLPFL